MQKSKLLFFKDFPQADNFSQKLYQSLIATLRYHGYLYYTQDDPLVSDQEYDLLYKLLLQVEKQNPSWRSPNSPSLKTGGEIRKEFPPAPHNPPMLSLDNADNFLELQEFETRLKKLLQNSPWQKEKCLYHAEPKFDGIAVELIYQNGNFVNGSTRGNGEVGEDITHNLRTVKNIPLQLTAPFPQQVSIRGECVMPLPAFTKLNENLKKQDGKPFANPRNAAAGSLRQQNSAITAERNLYFFPYALGGINGSDAARFEYARQSLLWNDFFTTLGFAVSPLEATGSLQEIEKFYQETFAKRHLLRYDLDGVVVKYDNLAAWQTLGETAKSPRYAIAYKFPAQVGITRLTQVSFQVGRTGVITPVAHLDPISIGGVVVQRASLHNIAELERLQIVLPCLVKVKRAGDVIPKVMERVQETDINTHKIKEENPEEKQEVIFPQNCPSCGKPLQQEEVFIRCVNPECSAKRLALLKYQVSRAALDMESLGEEWIEKLFSLKIIQTLSDIYALQEKDLLGLEGMGEILRTKILASIAARKKISFSTFLLSLGIRGIGPKSAKTVAQEFDDYLALQKTDLQTLQSLPDIGPVLAESLLSYFQDKKSLEEIAKTLANGVVIVKEKKADRHTENIFAQKIFVFTGTLQNLQRAQAQNLVETLGGKASGSVSSKTNYVVCGEKAGSKERKALQLGVAVLSEDDFLAMLPSNWQSYL